MGGMVMSFDVGSIVWGDRGIRCEVIGAFKDTQTGQIKIKVTCPGGDRLISPEQIKGIESNAIQVGDRVRLKNSDRHYSVTRIYPVRAGKDSAGEWITEAYCSLEPKATWKLNQLEKQ